MFIPESHIHVDNYVWYSGRTSMFTWNCPARICEVDYEERWFRVMSCDDMKEQKPRYSFDETANDPDSRKTMQMTTMERVAEYLEGKK